MQNCYAVVVTVVSWDSEVVRRESLDEASKHLAELADAVERDGERVLLTRDGHADVVLLSADELESIEETLALLNDPVALREIAEAEAAVAAGDVVTGEELRAQYGLPPYRA